MKYTGLMLLLLLQGCGIYIRHNCVGHDCEISFIGIGAKRTARRCSPYAFDWRRRLITP